MSLVEGQGEDPGSYRLVCLISILEQVMEQIIPETISNNIKVILHNQHGFMKGNEYLSNLIAFYKEITNLMDEEGAEVDFSKAFNTS